MQNKRLIFAFLIIFPLLAGLACRFTAKEPEPTQTPIVIPSGETEEPVEAATEEAAEIMPEETEAFQDLIMLDNGQWFQDGSSILSVFFFQNANSNIIFEDVEYTVYYYDSNGEEITSDYSFVHWIFPGKTFGVVFNTYLDDESFVVDSANVEWGYDDTVDADGLYNPFTVSNVVFWDNDGYPIVTAIINNSDSNTYTDIRTNIICYNSGGEIVGGGYTYVDFAPGEDYMGFSDYVDTYDTVASVEVYPTFSYSSLIYEGADSWSEVSVVDDNFYLNAYDGIEGGLEIQSNIDTTLTDSIVAITFYDSEGNVTTTSETYIDILLPHQTLGFSPWTMYQPDGAQTDSYDILVLPGEYDENYEVTENPFVVNSTELTGDWDDKVTVNFTNTYGKQASEVDIYVLLYDADGKIIGGGSDWTSDPIPAGGTAEVELWMDYGSDKEVASIWAWVVPNYWTEYE